jgi:membrane-associated phospholipid phosphatase
VTQVDWPADRRIQSVSLQNQAGLWSNIGLGAQIASGALAYTIGCRKNDRSYLSETGFTALAAMGAAAGANLALKAAFNRQYPYQNSSQGNFWAGGKSFPSGHSAASFAFASVVAHRYPQNKWIKWGAYATAAGISLARYPAKKHFPSDIVAGATLGYVIGTYMADHSSY